MGCGVQVVLRVDNKNIFLELEFAFSCKKLIHLELFCNFFYIQYKPALRPRLNPLPRRYSREYFQASKFPCL